MYRYYQQNEKSAWIPVEAREAALVAARNNAKKLTVLAVSELLDDDSRTRPKLRYSGPLYFDIDCKADLPIAIDSARKLVGKLIRLGVETADIAVFCSGSKGLHILVPAKAFYSGKPTLSLPQIYKIMARELHVIGLDYAVYCGGRGNSWRIVNQQRADGNYRVQIRHEDLDTLDEAKYRELVSAPRPVLDPARPPVKAPRLTALFESAKLELNRRVAEEPLPVSADELRTLEGAVPACITELVNYKRVNPDRNFNYAATQLSTYIVRSGVAEDTAESLVALLADNGHSSQYNTERLREEHIQGQIQFVKHSPGFLFGCGAVKACLIANPCKECPVKKHRATADNTVVRNGIECRDDGYYSVSLRSERQITSFVMTPESVFIDSPQDGTANRRHGTRMELSSNGRSLGVINFIEDCWATKAQFKKALLGLPGVYYYGSEDELQKLKQSVYEQVRDVEEVSQVWCVGMHINKVRGTMVNTFVEPDWSVNAQGVTDTHKLTGQIICETFYRETRLPHKDGSDSAALEHALVNLFCSNKPLIMAHTIGWFVATHLKRHLMILYHQFPLLNIWGGAGAGKSKVSRLLGCLTGMDLDVRSQVPSCPTMTPYPALEFGASSTTVPRFYEEFNASKIRQSSYDLFIEIFKAAWSEDSALRGTIGARSTAGRTGATVQQIPITGPVCFISEQSVSVPALVERTLSVMVSKQGRQGTEHCFKAAEKCRDEYRMVAKALMYASLHTSLDDVRELFDATDKMLPKLDDRPRYCQQISMLGLMFLRKVLVENLGLSGRTEASLRGLTDALQAYFTSLEEIAESFGARTEVDEVLNDLFLLISLAGSDGNDGLLVPGAHYLTTPDYFYMQPVMCHTAYKRSKIKYEHNRPVIDRHDKFIELLQHEPYFSGYETIPGNVSPMVKLDVRRMAERGLDVSFLGF